MITIAYEELIREASYLKLLWNTALFVRRLVS